MQVYSNVFVFSFLGWSCWFREASLLDDRCMKNLMIFIMCTNRSCVKHEAPCPSANLYAVVSLAAWWFYLGSESLLDELLLVMFYFLIPQLKLLIWSSEVITWWMHVKIGRRWDCQCRHGTRHRHTPSALSPMNWSAGLLELLLVVACRSCCCRRPPRAPAMAYFSSQVAGVADPWPPLNLVTEVMYVASLLSSRRHTHSWPPMSLMFSQAF
jgi:hypothetical protein